MSTLNLSGARWRRSSFSDNGNGNCVEIALVDTATATHDSENHAGGARWRKSSRSNGNGNACVEIASVCAATAIRDSKNRAGGVLLIKAGAWERFRADIDNR